MNYFDEIFKLNIDELETLPINACPTHFINITIEGLPEAELSENNSNWIKNSSILGIAFRGIQENFSEEYIFSEPVLYWQPPNELQGSRYQVKAGMMKKEIWEQIKEKHEIH